MRYTPDKQIPLKKFYGDFTPDGPCPIKRNGFQYNEYGFIEFDAQNYAPIQNKKFFSTSLDGGGLNKTSKEDYKNAAKWFLENNKPHATLATGGQGIVVNGQYYAMHHMEDSRTLVPILGTVHNAASGASHTGGASVIRNTLQGLFPIK